MTQVVTYFLQQVVLGGGGTIVAGNYWLITVAGTLGGTPVTPGNTLTALVTSPGQTSSNWFIQQSAVSSVNDQTGAVSLGISNMNDVSEAGLANGQVLIWNNTSSKWVNANITATAPTTGVTVTNSVGGIALNTAQPLGTGSTPTFVSTNLTGLSGQINSNGNLFTVPQTANSNAVIPATAAANNFLTGISSGGVISSAQPSLSGLSGVSLSGLLDAQILIYNNGTTNWVNQSVSGDATITNTGGLTLATVNGAPGSTTLSSITTNAKGLVTSNTTGNLTGDVTSVGLATTYNNIVPLTKGGTNNNLVASNGGIVWSDASKFNILSGTATAKQMLVSGATATPAWSTNTWPTTNAQGDLLYGSAANTITTLTKNTTATRYLANTGTSNNPNWDQINLTNGVTGVLPSANGGTGVNNGNSTLTLAGNLATSGAFASTFTMTGPTSVTFPTSGTLATTSIAGVTSVSGTINQIDVSPTTGACVVSIDPGYVGQTSITTLGTIGMGVWQGTVISPTYGGTGVNNSTNTLTITANSAINQDVSITASPTFNNVTANNLVGGTTSTVGSGQTVNLTKNSAKVQVVTGTTITYNLPDATTLTNGWTFQFNNNASGIVTVNNFSSSLITTAASGSYLEVILLSNLTSAGTWDYHWMLPPGVSWGTTTLNWSGTMTGSTWNGGVIGPTYGGTGVNNGSKTLTLGGNLATSGAFASTFTMTGPTSVTFPTSGTLATTAGANIPSVAQGDLLYGSASNTLTTLAKNTTATRYLANTGTSNNPNWDQIDLTTGVTGILPVANGGTNTSLAFQKAIFIGAGAQSIPNNSSTAVQFNTTTVANTFGSNLTLSGSNSVFTNTSGATMYVQVSYCFRFANLSATQVNGYIQINSTGIFYAQSLFEGSSSSQPQAPTGSVLLALNNNDAFSVYAFQNSGGAVLISSNANASASVLTIYQLP